MFEDDAVSSGPKRSLDDMSLEELAERIDALKAEIAACEAEIDKKQAVKRAADAAFGG
ncbi:MAG: DUF1192 domain-containing protein [Pseudomonadota bacterium]